MSQVLRKLGWKRDKADPKDYILEPRFMAIQKLPKAAKLKHIHPPIYDQGAAGSCTANGGCAAIDYDHYTETGKFYFPSRMALYAATRVLENGAPGLLEDSGAAIRDTVKAAVKYGVPPESMWSYDVDNHLYVMPPKKVMAEALKWQTLTYYRIPDGQVNLIKQAIVNNHPIVFGAMLFDSFMSAETAKTGMVLMPNPYKENPQGGHCMTIVCYKVINGITYYGIRNSWGTNWGDNGIGWIPEEYFTHIQGGMYWISDLWVFTSVEIGK